MLVHQQDAQSNCQVAVASHENIAGNPGRSPPGQQHTLFPFANGPHPPRSTSIFLLKVFAVGFRPVPSPRRWRRVHSRCRVSRGLTAARRVYGRRRTRQRVSFRRRCRCRWLALCAQRTGRTERAEDMCGADQQSRRIKPSPHLSCCLCRRSGHGAGTGRYAPTSRPRLKRCGSPILRTKHNAVSGPTPAIC